jgi:hypothetical protein
VDDYLADRDFVDSISLDVLGSLNTCGFFSHLEDQLCPADSSKAPQKCSGDLSASSEILVRLGYDDLDIEEIAAVFRLKGACCDCEILYNVAADNRLKARYWKARSGEPSLTTHPVKDEEDRSAGS